MTVSAGRSVVGQRTQVPRVLRSLQGHALSSEDEHTVTFNGSRGGAVWQSISGTVNLITGKFDAQETALFRSGNLSHVVWDLRCKPP